ncbi:MAG: asparagine synthase C-terminal domain-containing protein, partial [Methermicoccaceae archaeon]
MLYADIETAVRALNNALLSATSKLRGWIAFSGGVDSSIIAAMCPSLPLISFAVEGSKDASWVLEAGELLGRDIELVEVGIDEVEHHLRDVVALLHTTNPLDVVLATPLYIMGKHIVNKGEETVKNKDLRREIISGQGADELFGGYNKYEKMDEVLLSSVMRD